MDVVGHHSDNVLCWVNLRPFGIVVILHVPLLIFPRVVLGGEWGFLERNATSLSPLKTPTSCSVSELWVCKIENLPREHFHSLSSSSYIPCHSHPL